MFELEFIFHALLRDLGNLGVGILWVGALYLIPAVIVAFFAAAWTNPTYWRDVLPGMFWGLVVGGLVWSVVMYVTYTTWQRFSPKYNDLVARQIFFGSFLPAAIIQFIALRYYYRWRIQERIRLQDPNAQPVKRRFAFSLRNILLLQIGLAMVFSIWLGYRRSDIRHRQAEAEWKNRQASIQARFGEVGWQIRAQFYYTGLELQQTLRTPLPGFSEAVLKQLTPADRLKWLEIRSDALTDAGLDVISQQEKITWLDLQSVHVTDKGIAHLKKLKSLQYLHLDCPQLTEKVLADLGEMESLKHVTLYRSQIPKERGVEFEIAHPDVKIGIFTFMR